MGRWVWMGVGCPSQRVRNDIVSAYYSGYFIFLITSFHIFSRCQRVSQSVRPYVRPSVDSFVEESDHHLIRFTFKQSIYPIMLIHPLTHPPIHARFSSYCVIWEKSEFWSISANKLLEESSTESTDKLRGKLIIHALGSSVLMFGNFLAVGSDFFAFGRFRFQFNYSSLSSFASP